MNIIGLDLSLSSTGYSIIDYKGNVLTYGLINTLTKDDDSIRIYKIANKIKELIKEHNVNVAVLENSFFGKNPNTGLKLARLCGAVFYVCVECGVKVEMLAPTTTRKILLGDGKAKKDKVATFIRENHIDVGEYSDKKGKGKTSDLYDSLALSFAYLKKYKLNNK